MTRNILPRRVIQLLPLLCLGGCLSTSFYSETPDLFSTSPASATAISPEALEDWQAKLQEQVTADGPQAHKAHFGLGQIALGRGDQETAVAHFEKAIERKEDSADYWAFLASSQLRLEQHEEALTSSQRALLLDPDHGLAHVTMAEYVATYESDYPKALAHVDAAKAAGYSPMPPELESSLRDNLN